MRAAGERRGVRTAVAGAALLLVAVGAAGGRLVTEAPLGVEPTHAAATHAAAPSSATTASATTSAGTTAGASPRGTSATPGRTAPTGLPATARPTYGVAQPDGSVQDPPPLPLGPGSYGDPNAVVIRRPAQDFGSGFLGNYGIYPRETSPAAELDAAAKAPDGCLIIGDSIATTVVKHLVAGLRDSLGATCVYDTWPGRATEGTANALLDIKARHGLPPRIVVMSGTNDIFNPPLFEGQMDRLLDGIGAGHQVYWVSTFDSRRPKTDRSAADERNTAYINGVLTARAARTPGMAIVPWDALFRGDATKVDQLLRDGVHPNSNGVVAMVDLVSRSLS